MATRYHQPDPTVCAAISRTGDHVADVARRRAATSETADVDRGARPVEGRVARDARGPVR